jgi:hypothetical protein
VKLPPPSPITNCGGDKQYLDRQRHLEQIGHKIVALESPALAQLSQHVEIAEDAACSFAREVVRACEHAGIVVGSFGGTVREYD